MDEKLKFGIISLIVIIFQSALKIYGVIITGSLSFLSETVDTIVDIVFVSITLYSIKHSQKPPDYEHMWGHSKTDPIGALIQGIILINLYIILVFILENNRCGSPPLRSDLPMLRRKIKSPVKITPSIFLPLYSFGSFE